MEQPPRRFDEMPPAQQAGILCNDPRFQKFAALRSGIVEHSFNSSGAAEYLRTCCKITSRSALNTDEAARTKFQTLRTDFDAWTGRIATPR